MPMVVKRVSTTEREEWRERKREPKGGWELDKEGGNRSFARFEALSMRDRER